MYYYYYLYLATWNEWVDAFSKTDRLVIGVSGARQLILPNDLKNLLPKDESTKCNNVLLDKLFTAASSDIHVLYYLF